MLDQMPDHLLRLTAQAEAPLASFNQTHWNASRGPGKWTRLQVLGHLIDSAANNHQRFVRALAQPRLDWPGYDQMAHVAVQSYAAADPAVCLARVVDRLQSPHQPRHQADHSSKGVDTLLD